MSRTHEALLRAEARHKSRYSKSHDPVNIEQKLLQLNLSEEDLANQNLSQLIQSLHSINACIREPSQAVDIYFDESSFSRKEIFSVLLKRKWLVLELIDTTVTDKNMKKIRSMLKHIQNNKIRATIEKRLSFLYRKNEILKKEYRSIAAFDAEQTKAIEEKEKAFKAPSLPNIQYNDMEESTPNESKSSMEQGSLSIIITGSLLAIWGVAITLTHFLEIPVPVISEYAFLVTLGFLLGILFRISQKGGSQKGE